jgi:hypothetical protein
MSKMSYVYDILSFDPINTNSFNLLTRVKINPDIKLLSLFEKAPLHNILCKLSGTNSQYDQKTVYGKIDKSLLDDSYYITLDHIWNSYPDKNGKIEFLEKSVEETIEYLVNDGSPVINEEKDGPLNLLYNDSEDESKKEKEKEKEKEKKYTENDHTNPKMNLYDIIIPISISLIIIGILSTKM